MEFDTDIPPDSFWGMLTREPHTGVGVITKQGTIEYLNDQAARIFHGPDARAQTYLGRSWSDHMPMEWTTERLELFERVAKTGIPMLVRTIWRGFQQFTWVYPIRRDEGEPELFLTMTRRAQTDEEALSITNSDQYEWVDSNVANLGPLAALSERELEVLALMGQGLSVEQTAKALYRSPDTIKSHRKSIASKLNQSDRVLLARIASRAGLRLDDADRTRVESEQLPA